MKYLFKKPLIEGLIKSRPNRFIMNVEINNRIEKCHCPSTGKIGNLKFEDIPCLVSQAEENSERKTKFTVEAFSLNEINEKNKKWIGINQTKANAYVEFFLKNNQLSKIIPEVKELKREVSLGDSRIDFFINNRDYLEVKTPLKDIDCSQHSKCINKRTPFTSFERLIKHFGDISKNLKDGKRAILLMCYIFNAPEFKVPPVNKQEERIVSAAKKARAKGLENWQINLKIDKEGVELIDYFRLNLF